MSMWMVSSACIKGGTSLAATHNGPRRVAMVVNPLLGAIIGDDVDYSRHGQFETACTSRVR